MAESGGNLAGRLLSGAAERGQSSRTALGDENGSWTYDELAERVRRVAGMLRGFEVDPGQRVAVLLPDSRDSAVALLGAIYAGCVAVPISDLGRDRALRDLLNDAKAAVVVVDNSTRAVVDAVRGELSHLREVVVSGDAGAGEKSFEESLASAQPLAEAVPVADDDPAFLLYSAGARANMTEDEEGPVLRGVLHGHGAPWLSYQQYARDFLSMSGDDRVLCTVRLSTAYGLGSGLLYPLAAGARARLVPATTRAVFDAARTFEPTMLFSNAYLYREMVRDAEELGGVGSLADIRHCVTGGEAMPPPVAERVKESLGAELMVGYGLTEAFQFVIAGKASRSRAGEVGRPLSGYELRIVGDDGQPVPVNEIGTLEIRGAPLTRSYLGEEPGEGDDGWFRTRDRFLVDGDGTYCHCGRVDQLIKVAGEWMSPTEVELALSAHEAVWECAVIGADDEDGLIKPFAFVVVNIGHEAGPALEAELRTYVKDVLATHKDPRWVEFVDELPKGPFGKVLRYKLQELLRTSKKPRRAVTTIEHLD